MLTPKFTIEQQDNFLLISLKCPFIKSQNVEIFIEKNEFKFYAKTYFLRLLALVKDF